MSMKFFKILEKCGNYTENNKFRGLARNSAARGPYSSEATKPVLVCFYQV